MKLIVTIPAQNEERTIGRVVAGALDCIQSAGEVQVLVLDDGSSDRTAEVAAKAGAAVIPIHGRPGLGKVFQEGVEAAMRLGADIVVNIDGDGQFDPADIPRLVEPILNDEADFVTCSRFKNAAYRPQMPAVKYWGNWAVVKIVNSICGGSRFTDVSCGFRAFNREALYRMTLFGTYTYTQESFIDLFAKGLRIAEVPLRVRGVREHGRSRVANSIWKYATNTGPIILRAMRDIRPLKFFGLIGLILFVLAVLSITPVIWHYMATKKTQPFQSLITVSGVLVTLAFVMGVLALLADMMARHRRITEELLYLARRRVYGDVSVKKPAFVPAVAIHGATNGSETALASATGRPRALRPVLAAPVHRSVKDNQEPEQEEEFAAAQLAGGDA